VEKEQKRDLVVSTGAPGATADHADAGGNHLGWIDLSQFRLDAPDAFLHTEARIAGAEQGAARTDP